VAAHHLRLWAAGRQVTGFADLPRAAAVAGIDPFALHDQITRSYRRGR